MNIVLLIAVIVAIVLIIAFTDFFVGRNMGALQNKLFESTKHPEALFHEKCIMAHSSRMECPAVIAIFNDKLIIYPVIGEEITVIRGSLRITQDDSAVKSHKYAKWKKHIVTLLDNKNSRRFIFGFDDSQKLSAFISFSN